MAQSRARKRSKSYLAAPHSNLQDDNFSPSGNVLRQRRQSLKQKHEAKEELQKRQPQRSLIRQICVDVRHLLAATYKLSRWLALLLGLWLAVTHVLLAAKAIIVGDLDHVCSLWVIGPMTPLCHPRERLDLIQVPYLQHQLEKVMDSSARGLDLSRYMSRSEIAVSDLSKRVKRSHLSNKSKLGDQLDELINVTRSASYDISGLTSQIGSLADSVIASDLSAIDNLQAIYDRPEEYPNLFRSIMSFLSPLSAFAPKYKDENELKSIFMRTTNQMATGLPTLIEEAGQLDYLLRRIQDAQPKIERLAAEEIKQTSEDLPVLTRLWATLKGPNESDEYHKRTLLLNITTKDYAKAFQENNDTLHGLKNLRSDLDKLDDIYARPAVFWRKVLPVQFMIDMMNNSLRDLEDERSRLGVCQMKKRLEIEYARLVGIQLEKKAQESSELMKQAQETASKLTATVIVDQQSSSSQDDFTATPGPQ